MAPRSWGRVCVGTGRQRCVGTCRQQRLIRPPRIRRTREQRSLRERDVGHYSCQVWRLDTYRVQPTLQAEPSQLADEEWLVLDHGLDWRQLRAATAEELLVVLFEDIERRFGVKVDLPAGSTSPPGSDQG